MSGSYLSMTWGSKCDYHLRNINISSNNISLNYKRFIWQKHEIHLYAYYHAQFLPPSSGWQGD